MMHMLTKSLVGLGFAGVMAMSAPTATLAQGIYFQGPGVEFGVGRPYRERYYRTTTTTGRKCTGTTIARTWRIGGTIVGVVGTGTRRA